MAKVSHHAMRRYPVGPLDPTTSASSSGTHHHSANGAGGTANGATSATTPTFYTSPSQRVTVIPPTDNNSSNKSSSTKKTWGQRLKITKSDKTTTTPSPTNNFVSSDILDYENLNGQQSALSKSMKYTETYLYGTVRGIPAPRANGGGGMGMGQSGLLFSHHFPQEVAVVVCSCPEFLNGTKRELKKASICKKCKGSRLPLAPIGGTMRIHSSSAIISTPSRTSAGTMRLLSTSSKKSRPSILDSQNDPYDLMRRNRLVSPDLKSLKQSAKDSKFRNRAKSQSPSRSRNKNRKRSPSPNENSINMDGSRSRSATRNGSGSGSSTKECWIDITETEVTARRSILRCEINPYDLISKRSQNFNEFSPSHDDDDFNYSLELNSRKYENMLDGDMANQQQHNYKNVAAIAGQRMRLFGKTKMHAFEEPEKFIYDPIEVQTHTAMSTVAITTGGVATATATATVNTTNTSDMSHTRLIRALSPVRPPRRKQERNIDEQQQQQLQQQYETLDTSPVIDLIPSPVGIAIATINATTTSTTTTSTGNAVGVETNNNYNSIRSILKRPSSLSTSNDNSMLKDNDNCVGELQQQQSSVRNNNNGIEIISSNKSHLNIDRDRRNSGSQFYLPMPSPVATGVGATVASTTFASSTTKPKTMKTVTVVAATMTATATATATATRKKVQFVVENEIIQDESSGEEEGGMVGDDGHNLYDTVHNDVVDELPSTQVLLVVPPTAASSPIAINSPIVITGNVTATKESEHGAAIDRHNANVVAFNNSKNLNNQLISEIMNKQQNVNEEELKFKYETVTISSQNIININTATRNGHFISSDESNEDDIEKLELTQIPQRNCILRRSFSDRRTKMRNPINFLDTTALRNRPVRVDSRRLFEEEVQLRTARPKEPPPPVPERKTKKYEDEEENIYEDFFIKSNDTSTTINLNKTIVNITTSSPTTSPTIARIQSPLVINRESAAIHRLEIKHNDNENDDLYNESLKKTSILISGDDCYSTVNVSDNTPLYQSSVVVNDEVTQQLPGISKTSSNTVTISVSSPKIMTSPSSTSKTAIKPSVSSPTTISNTNATSNGSSTTTTTTTIGTIALPLRSMSATDEDIIYKNNKKNTLLNINSLKSIIPIGGNDSGCDAVAGNGRSGNDYKSPKSITTKSNSRTFISADYDRVSETAVTSSKQQLQQSPPFPQSQHSAKEQQSNGLNKSDSEEIEIILRNPVEAVKRNLVPHVCGRTDELDESNYESPNANPPMTVEIEIKDRAVDEHKVKAGQKNDIIAKLLEDPTLGHLAEGLEEQIIAKLIENSLIRLKESRSSLDMSGTKDEDDVTKLIDMSLQKIQEQKLKIESSNSMTSCSSSNTLSNKKPNSMLCPPSEPDRQSNRSSMSSGNSYGSASYELMEFDHNGDLSDCYQSCSSDLTTDDDATSTRSKFYQMLVDATLSEIETTTVIDDDHHYESIRLNCDPIYEEISDVPPPLPLSSPPLLIDDPEFDKKNNSRSIFEGASKYDILSYLVDAKERGIVAEESYTYNFNNANDIIIEEEDDDVTVVNHQKMADRHQRQISDVSSRISQLSTASDSSEDNSSISTLTNEKAISRKQSSDIERNDSGVGSETSKTSRSKWQHPNNMPGGDKTNPMHLCEDCDGSVETQVTDSGVMYAPLVCRKCGKKRAERKEILTEIVETEEKYGRDLQIILEEFYQPMLVAGLLTQDQLSAIFLNTEELLENNQSLAERMRDAFDIANEQGDDDLLTVNIGKIFLEAAPMLHAFESYCVRQGAASLLLANLEKEKELLRIFLRVSQMENTVLRRMNLNSFLMVPVQRVTKYPLLLARLFKVTPHHLDGRELLKQAQEKIELHLNHMNREAKDVPTKLWRRISSSSPGRRSTCEIDMINIKLRKMAVDILEWNHDEVRFALEGRLLFTQPTDNNWRKGRTIKLAPINALLVTNGKPSANYKADRSVCEPLNFPRHTGIREASLLLVREKSGRYTLLREPLYLDRCIICTETEWEDYFEVQEVLSKDTFIFKAEDGSRTKQWYTQLQYHSQGMGAWRKRRNALANIMINGMMTRT